MSIGFYNKRNQWYAVQQQQQQAHVFGLLERTLCLDGLARHERAERIKVERQQHDVQIEQRILAVVGAVAFAAMFSFSFSLGKTPTVSVENVACHLQQTHTRATVHHQ
jgi:hypothetical protein